MRTTKYAILTMGFYIGGDAIMGFSSYYLLKTGAANSLIGIIFAVAAVFSVILQLRTSQVVDHSEKLSISQIIMIFSALMILCAVLLLAGVSQPVAAALLFLFMMVMNFSLISFINALGMYYTNRGYRINYGVARGLGSLSYTLASVTIGYFSDEKRFGPSFIPMAVICSSSILILVLLSVQRSSRKATGEAEQRVAAADMEKNSAGVPTADAGKAAANPGRPTLGAFIAAYPRFSLVTLGMVLAFVMHNILCNYTIQIITPMGGGSTETGIIAAISAVGEIPVMFLFSKLMQKYRPGTLIRFAAVFFTVRAMLLTMAFCVGSIPLFYAMSATQILGYAIFIPASVYYANQVISEKYLAMGQAFMALTNTLGIAIGSLVGGPILDFAGVLPLMITGCAASAVGTLIVIGALSGQKRGQ